MLRMAVIGNDYRNFYFRCYTSNILTKPPVYDNI